MNTAAAATAMQIFTVFAQHYSGAPREVGLYLAKDADDAARIARRAFIRGATAALPTKRPLDDDMVLVTDAEGFLHLKTVARVCADFWITC